MTEDSNPTNWNFIHCLERFLPVNSINFIMGKVVHLCSALIPQLPSPFCISPAPVNSLIETGCQVFYFKRPQNSIGFPWNNYVIPQKGNKVGKSISEYSSLIVENLWFLFSGVQWINNRKEHNITKTNHCFLWNHSYVKLFSFGTKWELVRMQTCR